MFDVDFNDYNLYQNTQGRKNTGFKTFLMKI